MCLKKWSALKVFCLLVDTAFAQGCHMLARILSEWLSLPEALMARHSSMPSFWHWSRVWLFPGDKWKPQGASRYPGWLWPPPKFPQTLLHTPEENNLLPQKLAPAGIPNTLFFCLLRTLHHGSHPCSWRLGFSTIRCFQGCLPKLLDSRGPPPLLLQASPIARCGQTPTSTLFQRGGKMRLYFPSSKGNKGTDRAFSKEVWMINSC